MMDIIKKIIKIVSKIVGLAALVGVGYIIYLVNPFFMLKIARRNYPNFPF